MRGFRTGRWQHDVQELVDRLLKEPDPSPALVAEVIEHVRRSDVGDDGDVTFALHQLFRIGDGLRGSETAQLALVETVELALASFKETKKPSFVHGVAKHLQGRGRSDLSLFLLERAIELDVGATVDGVPAIVGLLNQKGELLREAGSPGDAEAAFLAASAAMEGGSAAVEAVRAIVLNNLGLVYYMKGDLPQARKYLIESLADIRL